MSQITLTGSIYGRGKDEDVSEGLRYASSGKAFLNFKVAAYGGKDKDGGAKDKVYWTCVAFGDLAEHIAESCSNGDSVIVQGRVESNNWTTDDGTKRYDTQIVVFECGLSLRWDGATSHRADRDDKPAGAGPKPQAREQWNPDEAPF